MHVYSSFFDDPATDRGSTISHFECHAIFFVAESPLSRNSRHHFSFRLQRRLTQRVHRNVYTPRVAKVRAAGVLIGVVSFGLIYDRPMIDFGW